MVIIISPDKPLVFICHPYQGMEENLERIKAYCKEALNYNCVPIAPALHYPLFLDDSIKEQRDTGLACSCKLISVCDEFWICGSGPETEGMTKEIAFARQLKKRIKTRT